MGTGRTAAAHRRREKELQSVINKVQAGAMSVQSGQNGDTSNATTQTDKTPHYRDSVDNFRNMSINDATNFYNSVKTGISSSDIWALNLRDSGYQKTVLALGLHDKPLVLSDADFDKSFKTESATPILYRGIGHADAVDNSKYGDLLFASEGIHGDGAAYCTTRKTYAIGYGYGKDRNGKDTGFTAYIDKNKMKAVTEGDLRRMISQESASVRQAFRHNTDLPTYALYKGYNCIHVPGGNAGGHHAALNNPHAYKKVNGRVSGEDYYVPLTRGILVIREHAK